MTLIKSISGIRGTIGGKSGETLSPNDVVKFVSAYGFWLKETTQKAKVVIGRDARPSGEAITKIASATLQSLGIDVVDLGLTTTPTVEIATVLEHAGGGLIVTASHNPIQWNALKLLNEKGEFLSETDGLEVLRIADNEQIEYVDVKKQGSYSFIQDGYMPQHIKMILDLPLVDVEAIRKRNFRIALDCVNSTGGIAVPMLLTALGVKQFTKFYCDPHGLFPHNPEPIPENLNFISKEIENGHYDLGIVVDPDVDRLALICEDGMPFGEEYTLVGVADYILKNKPGNTVSNLSSSRALQDVTEKNGGEYFFSAVGEVNVVEAMKEYNAVIGGEGNGGVIYPDLHYGRDAMVGIALFLSHLAKFGQSMRRLKATYPEYHISKNKIELDPTIDIDDLFRKIKFKYNNNPITTIDGIKVIFGKEWVHLRKSNTEPIIRIYAESDSVVTADHLASKLMMDIREFLTPHGS